jgi:hypothetical protein
MIRIPTSLVVGFALFLPTAASADIIGLYQPGTGVIDLGNIASDGSGGRQIVIRPAEPDDVGKAWNFFPPHLQLQQTYYLMANAPLILAIPQLAHFPSGASVAVSYSIDHQEITVDASLHDAGFVTGTIYGPHEYLLPIAGLDAGDYHLTFNMNYSSAYSPYVTQTLAFSSSQCMRFQSPSSWVTVPVACSSWAFRGARRAVVAA